MQEDRFRKALQALGDFRRTTIILVTRADRGAIREAARTSGELDALNLSNQLLAVNGRFHATDPTESLRLRLSGIRRGSGCDALVARETAAR